MPYEDFLDKRLFGPLGMKDTTFWPSEEQVKRLAKSYKPSADKKDLEEVKIGQLRYPLNDRKNAIRCRRADCSRRPRDVGRFCQMMLNGGTLNGKKILSEDAVKQLTSKQTGDSVKDNYGLGWSAGSTFGHGGAHATNMSVDTKRGLVFVWMVQAAGGYPGNGGQAQGAFNRAASEEFGKPKK